MLQGMWFDAPGVMMLPGMENDLAKQLQSHSLGALHELAQAVRADGAATEKLLSTLVGKQLAKEWTQVKLLSCPQVFAQQLLPLLETLRRVSADK